MPTTYTVIDVQQATSSPVTSKQAPAFAANPVTGDLVLVGMTTWKSGGGVTHQAPTDTAGNTYAQVGSTIAHPAGNIQLSMWRCVGATGGATFRVTANLTPAAYVTLVAWCVRPSTAILYNADVATQANASDNAANDPTTTPAPPGADAFFFCVAGAAGGDNVLTEGTGWSATGVNGFTAGMKTAAKYGLNSATVALYTEYILAATVKVGSWDDTSSNFNSRSVMVASFGPASSGASALPRFIPHYRQQGIM